MSGLNLRQSPHADLYNYALRAVYANQWRIYDPSFALAQDPDIYRKMREDANIELACQQRAAMVAGRDWIVAPASDDPDDVRLATLETAWLKRIRRFDQARERLAWAFFYGTTYEEMRGDFATTRLAGDDSPRRWFLLTQFENVRKMRFGRFRAPDGGLEWRMFSVDPKAGGRWVPLTDDEAAWYVKHGHEDTEETLKYGRGIVDSLYWSFFAKGIALNQGLAGLERWAQGWITAKVSGDREGSVDRDNDTVIDTWLQKLDEMRSRHALVYGQGDELQVVETSGAGHEIVSWFITYLDSQTTRLILGSLLPSGGGDASAGSLARSQTEANMTERRIQMDQAAEDDTITSDVLGLFHRMNRATLRDIGLGDAQPGHFQTLAQERQDPLKEAEVAQIALQSGIPLPSAEVYKRLGYPKPKKGEDVIEPMSAPVAGPGFGDQGGAREPMFRVQRDAS